MIVATPAVSTQVVCEDCSKEIKPADDIETNHG